MASLFLRCYRLFYMQYYQKILREKGNVIKEISREDVELLLKRGIIRNSDRGYIDKSGNEIGFYRTKGVGKKRYIQDHVYEKLNKTNSLKRG